MFPREQVGNALRQPWKDKWMQRGSGILLEIIFALLLMIKTIPPTEPHKKIAFVSVPKVEHSVDPLK